MNLIASVVLIVALGAGLMLFSSAELDPQQPKTLEELEEVAKLLESTDAKITASTGKQYARNDLLYGFSLASKSVVCKNYLSKLEKDIDDYKDKVTSFNKTLVSGKKPWLWNPINGMRSVSKQYKYLESITNRYESSSKLSQEDFDCDMNKFRISALNTMLSVLQADIKYLITENQEIPNIAINLELRRASRKSNHNFYNIKELKPVQVRLLSNYYARHVPNPNEKSINDALGNFYTITNMVFGRVLDSCHQLKIYLKQWSELETTRAEVCEKSEMDQQNKEAFADEFNQSAYNETLSLCKALDDDI